MTRIGEILLTRYLLESNWIGSVIKKPGALHRALHVPQGKKIPGKKLASAAKKAEKTGNTKMLRRINLAKELKGFNK